MKDGANLAVAALADGEDFEGLSPGSINTNNHLTAAANATTRSIDDGDLHPFRRMTETEATTSNNYTQENTTNTKILHKRSQSDTATLLEQILISEDENDDAPSNLRRPSSKDGGSASKPSGALRSVGVTFADRLETNSTRGREFDRQMARRRYSGSAATTSSTSLSSSSATSAPSSTSNNNNNNNSISTPSLALPSVARGRVYRSMIATDKLTTRDIAALDFLLGIPLEAEEAIVQHGYMLQQERKKTYQSSGGISGDYDYDDEDEYATDDEEDAKREEVLEPPTTTGYHASTPTSSSIAAAPSSHHGRWFEKWIPRENNNNSNHNTELKLYRDRQHKDVGELELPTASGLTDVSSLSATGVGGGGGGNNTPTMDGTRHSHISNVSATNKATSDQSQQQQQSIPTRTAPVYAPGRRLEGDEAIQVQIPLTIDTVTRQRSIARQAAIREWEIKVAHGLGLDSQSPPPQQRQQQQQQRHSSNKDSKPLLDGRMFFSAAGSYPLGVFSLKRYEPKREEAALRRQKLEARGGGGSHFVMPSRDWRGISYRALLPRKAEQARNQKAFNRFLRDSVTRKNSRNTRLSHNKSFDSRDRDDSTGRNLDDEDYDTDDNSDDSSSSSEEDYIPGILDDPEMRLGRHRSVMIGDVVTGCIVTSTIQFVKPALLKADLNAKFRERFDGWEPNKSQRKYIGARVVDGVYTLQEPTESTEQHNVHDDEAGAGNDKSNMSETSNDSSAVVTPAIIRMPPSLTLSKIRSVKRQALLAFAKANLEIGTVALACVYFERLCLSCRVDKTNRRLCFASCLLLATKINEPNEVLVMKEADKSATESGDEDDKQVNKRKKIMRLQSSIRPSKRSSSMFASLLEFFTQDWSLSLKHLFAAEWGVFAALRFSLHATPSQVAFHFKRLMKSLEWSPLTYLGPEMFAQWQDALATEEKRTVERERRREMREIRKQRRIQRELEKEVIRGKQQYVEQKDLMRRSKNSSKGKSPKSHPQQKQETSPPLQNIGLAGKIAVKKTKPAAQTLSRRNSHGDADASVPQGPPLPRRSRSSKYLLARSKSPHGSPKKDRSSLGSNATWTSAGGGSRPADTAPPVTPTAASAGHHRRARPIKLLTRFGMRRPMSNEKLDELAHSAHGNAKPSEKLGLPLSPSMPLIAQAASFPEDVRQHRDVSEVSVDTDMAKSKTVSTSSGGDSVVEVAPHLAVPDLPDFNDHDGGNDDDNSVAAKSDSGLLI